MKTTKKPQKVASKKRTHLIFDAIRDNNGKGIGEKDLAKLLCKINSKLALTPKS